MNWLAFRENDRREQEQLEVCRALIEDATKDTARWLQVGGSAEERIHVLAMQDGLAELARIVERGMERRKETRDDWVWSETVSEVLALVEKATEARGGQIVGKGLARLSACLPRELFGSKVHPVMPSASLTWRGFQNRFMELAREEQGRADVITKGETLRRMDRVLRAASNYEEHPEGIERGKPEQGRISLLETPRHGVWNYANDGISENFLERVRLCVAEAGRALSDYPKGADPEDFWLHRLCLDLVKNKSDLLWHPSETSRWILSVCIASVTFCARLERQTISQSEPGNNTGVVDSLRTRGNQAQTLSSKVRIVRFTENREHNLRTWLVEHGIAPTPDVLASFAQNNGKTTQDTGAMHPRTDARQAETSRAQNNDKTTQAESKPVGRPRKDAERDLVRKLKTTGKSWKEIAASVNTETGQNKSVEAYRSLLKSQAATKDSPGKNGQK